jgi:hypothetical protein
VISNWQHDLANGMDRPRLFLTVSLGISVSSGNASSLPVRSKIEFCNSCIYTWEAFNSSAKAGEAYVRDKNSKTSATVYQSSSNIKILDLTRIKEAAIVAAR